MRPLRAVLIGTEGFVHFVHGLRDLGVIDRDEMLGLLRLHGAVIRTTGLALDSGDGVPDELLERLGKLQ